MTIGLTEMKILELLQDNARITNQALADEIGMSAPPCWRKVRKLEEEGVIQGYRAVLDRKMIGLGVMAFVRVEYDKHQDTTLADFEMGLRELENVISCYSIGGDTDFLLQIVAQDIDAYADFIRSKLGALSGIGQVQSMFVLKEIKSHESYPIIPHQNISWLD